tara:strand:+ start:179 stop:298 length:120 start_codon:yes stop_codon:yes gene_type:complete
MPQLLNQGIGIGAIDHQRLMEVHVFERAAAANARVPINP